jgi:protein-S-isoprenylcysteine O-methyltransferase Ste14
MEAQAGIGKTIIIRLIAGVLLIGALLFLPAGSLRYWQAWLYLGVLFIPMLVVLAYLWQRDRDLLVRRMQTREKEPEQKTIIAITAIICLAAIVIPGLDFRFGWSTVPVDLVLASDAIVFLGYLVFFLTLRENSYASRIISVEKDQTVISTGPYAVVRHPMYLGALVMLLFTPPALGSVWGLVTFVPLLVMIVFRIRNEEQVLLRDLPGYGEYRGKVRYRLVPGVW